MTLPPLRTHGQPPYHLAVIHGGPGALGDLYPVATHLAPTYGVLEPLLTACTIDGQLNELHTHLHTNGSPPFVLIGHSWGAWLAYLYTARHPDIVSRLILVSSGPFDDRYAAGVAKTRLNRLKKEDRLRLTTIQHNIDSADSSQQNTLFAEIGRLLDQVDSYGPLLESDKTNIGFRYDVFTSVWTEADGLRKTGQLLKEGTQIRCPVVAIHGANDPHPAVGVSKPLKKILPDFRIVVLPRCGHYPWRERQARDAFYQALTEALR